MNRMAASIIDPSFRVVKGFRLFLTGWFIKGYKMLMIMSFRFITFLILFFSLTSPFSVCAGIYRYVDAQGKKTELKT